MNKVVKYISATGTIFFLINQNGVMASDRVFPAAYKHDFYLNGDENIIVGSQDLGNPWCGRGRGSAKNYNLKRDLGLPAFYTFNNIANIGYTSAGGSFINGQPQRHWNYSIYENNTNYTNSYYNLYTSNGKKWGICNPYYSVGINRYLTNSDGYSPKYIGYKPATGYGPHSCSPDTPYASIFYFPFSVNSSGQIKKELNIVSTSGHLNGKLDPNDIQIKFTFY